jgi:hypothetical protein
VPITTVPIATVPIVSALAVVMFAAAAVMSPIGHGGRHACQQDRRPGGSHEN